MYIQNEYITRHVNENTLENTSQSVRFEKLCVEIFTTVHI